MMATIEPGDIVRYGDHVCAEHERDARLVVLEVNGNRAILRLVCDMPIPPTEAVLLVDVVKAKIVQARQDLAARHEHLVRLRESKGDIFTAQLADYADKLLEALRNAQKTVTAQADAIEKTIRGKLTFDSKLLAELLDIKTKLQVQAHQRLDDAVKIAEHADSAQLARSYDTLKNAVAQASVALAEQEDRLAAAAVAEDDDGCYRLVVDGSEISM